MDVVCTAAERDVVGNTEREDAVLLFGALGRVGRPTLEKVLALGRPVIVAVRSAAKFAEKIGDMGEKRVTIVEGVDMTKAETLTAELFAGVFQVVICTGPSGIYMETATNWEAFEVDSIGVANVAAAAEKFMTVTDQPLRLDAFDLSNSDGWITRTYPDSGIEATTSIEVDENDNPKLCFSGELMPPETSFPDPKIAIAWSSDMRFDLSDSDGIYLSVKGGGQSYIVAAQTDEPDIDSANSYIASFDTAPGNATDVYIPFTSFRKTSNGQPDLDRKFIPQVVTKIGFIASTHTAEQLPNWNLGLKPFGLEILSISGYKAVRTQIVLVSSGGTERSARIGNDNEKRNEDIPIVRLNIGGVLNHKYEGENSVRRCRLPYTIIRPAGFIPESLIEADAPTVALQFTQGDVTRGRIRCDEVAEVIRQCLIRPEAFRTTFELRQNPGPEAKGMKMDDAFFHRQFSTLCKDEDRAKMGIPPFPQPVPVNQPILAGGRVPEETSQEIEESIAEQRASYYKNRKEELKK